MRWERFAAVAAALSAASAGAQPKDVALRDLIDEAAAASPEVQQARAAVAAERARAVAAGAFPDPTLSLGIQNDGFRGIEVGKMETSFYSVVATQPLPWPGKRGLREDVASLEARRAEEQLRRALLDVEARARRAFVALSVVRGDTEILDELQGLWRNAERVARARYEAGQAPQSDLLRAQVERARLEQRRFAVEASAVAALAEVNRLRNRSLDAPFEEVPRLSELPVPQLEGDAEERSPELALSHVEVQQAASRVALAQRERWPDLAVTAGVMPRGALEPMWQLGVSISLPIWSRRGSAVEAERQRQIAGEQGAEAVRQVLRLRTRERRAAIDALVRTNAKYREVLVLSAAAAKSTLAQYEVGRTTFASVLEAVGSYVADRAGELASLSALHELLIAQLELSLDPVAPLPGGIAQPSMATRSSAPRAAPRSAAAATSAAPQPAAAMGGM
jgi:outer membrane protein TolC